MTTPKPINGTPEADQQQNPPSTTSRSAMGRLELLVNSELFADVVFSVGSDETLMYGHKAILTMASDVFRAQFTGSFRESRENGQEHEILVVDIEPPVFTEILRYAYCDKATISADNVLHLLYAAEKYLLTKLIKKCTEFAEERLCEANVLEIFEQNRSYELEDINRKCLDIICLNPIRMFGDENFLTLDSKSLDLIAGCERMNCQLSHLLKAIDAWLKINEHDAERGNVIRDKVLKRPKLEYMCQNIQNFSSGRYQLDITTEMTVETAKNSGKNFYIYGIAIPLKMKQHVNAPQTVNIDLSITRQYEFAAFKSQKPVLIKRLTIPVSTFVHVEEIMFARQKIGNGIGVNIQIRMSNAFWPMFCMDKFTSDQPDVELHFSDSSSKEGEAINCVAYVLYDEGKENCHEDRILKKSKILFNF